MRCCILSPLVCDVLAGIPTQEPASPNNPISGGGDGTAVGAIFKVLSIQGAPGAPTANGEEDAETRNTTGSTRDLITQACLTLSTISQGLAMQGRRGASCMLTSSQPKQHARLAALAQQSLDSVPPLAPSRSAAAMLALSSILALEHGLEPTGGGSSWAAETALSLLPSLMSLRGFLKIVPANSQKGASHPTVDHTGYGTNAGMLTSWHGGKDGCVGLLEARLRWGGLSCIEQGCSAGFPLLLITLLAGGLKGAEDGTEPGGLGDDVIGLSPVGVTWAVSAIFHTLSGGGYRDVLFRREPMSTLLSLMNRVHLSHLHFWEGSGGGRDGLRAVVDRIVSVLEFPFMQAQTSPGSPSASPAVSAALVPGRSSPSGKVTNGELAKAMTANMHHYWQILQEVFSCCLLPEP